MMRKEKLSCLEFLFYLGLFVFLLNINKQCQRQKDVGESGYILQFCFWVGFFSFLGFVSRDFVFYSNYGGYYFRGYFFLFLVFISVSLCINIIRFESFIIKVNKVGFGRDFKII